MYEFWLVWRNGGGAPTKKHTSQASARKEAERLARANPGAEFVVLRSEGVCRRVDVQWEIPLLTGDELPIPF